MNFYRSAMRTTTPWKRVFRSINKRSMHSGNAPKMVQKLKICTNLDCIIKSLNYCFFIMCSCLVRGKCLFTPISINSAIVWLFLLSLPHSLPPWAKQQSFELWKQNKVEFNLKILLVFTYARVKDKLTWVLSSAAAAALFLFTDISLAWL